MTKEMFPLLPPFLLVLIPPPLILISVNLFNIRSICQLYIYNIFNTCHFVKNNKGHTRDNQSHIWLLHR